MKPAIRAAFAALFLAAAVAPAFGQAPTPPTQPEFIKQGQQLLREGKPEEALALYRKTLEASPESAPALLAAGSVLDLLGRGEEARGYFQKAIAGASTAEQKAAAQRQMAMSYAFESNCGKVIEYLKPVYDYQVEQKNFYQQGEIADEAARICLDSGDLDAAYRWYKTGYESGLREPEIKSARRDLWEFRWEHAQARIAARRGNSAEAQKHVAAAQAALDKGTNPEQVIFFPYLKGYVEFYGGEYRAALENLLKANQNDPFIQCLIGQTYEKLGEKEKALDYYRKAAAATMHNPTAAYAVPFSRKKLR